jgi:hypothetical protein
MTVLLAKNRDKNKKAELKVFLPKKGRKSESMKKVNSDEEMFVLY